MASSRQFGFLDVVLLGLVFATAAGTRAGYLLTCADGGRTAGPLLVQDPSPVLEGLPAGTEFLGRAGPTEQDALVHNLKEHRWFGSLAPFSPAEEQTAHLAPGYPWLLGLLARAVDPPTFDRTVRWIQVGLGALTAALYFLFTRRAFESRLVALLTGLLCAFYPFWIVNTAAVDDGTLTSFLLALVLFLGARVVQTAGPFASLLYGLTLAALALVRAALLPFSFIAIGWFLLRSRSVSRGWLCAVLAFLGFANGLAPWAVRNYQLFKEPLPVVDSAHLHLWIGNNAKATGGPANDAMLEAAPVEKLVAIKSQPDRYARLGQEWLQTVRQQPVPTLQRRVGAALNFFFGERWFKEQQLADVRAEAGVPMPSWLTDVAPLALLGSLIAMLVLALLGWRWTYSWRREAMPSSLALVWVPLPYILSHAESLSGPRLPLDGVLLCYAAFALACMVPGVGGTLLYGPLEERRNEGR